jgi:hypothetical protein
VGFLGGVFLGGFFWVGFLLPTLRQGDARPSRPLALLHLVEGPAGGSRRYLYSLRSILYSVQTTRRAVCQPVFRIRIHCLRIQRFGLNADPDPGPIQDFDDQKIEKT